MMLLSDYIDDPILMAVSSNAGTSDGLAASDNLAGVSILGISSVLFLVSHPNVIGEGGAGAQVQIQYSTTGSASDAATSNATMSCTDAVITFTTATRGAAGVYALCFNVSAKNLESATGKLFATVRNDSTSTIEVTAIPIVGTGALPAYTPAVVADD